MFMKGKKSTNEERITELEAQLEGCKVTIQNLQKELEEERERVKYYNTQLNKERKARMELLEASSPVSYPPPPFPSFPPSFPSLPPPPLSLSSEFPPRASRARY